MYSTLPSQCRICSTLRGNSTKEVLLQFWDYWETHYLGLICPGTTFFAGSLPGWWDFTAELKQHNFNTKVGLHALALVWKGGQLWKCLSGESIPPNCFLCVWTYCKIVHNGWKKIGALSSNPKMFFFLRTSPAWSSPWRRCRCLPSGLRRWRKILQLLNMLFPPRWDEYEQFSCEYEEMDEMDVFWWWHERDLAEFNMLIIMIMVHWVKIKQKLEWWKMVEWQ